MPAGYPQHFGQYILLRPLGAGGMGHVYLALAGEQGLETLVVIKRMLPALLARPEHVERFRHEADLARRLVHGNLVHTHAIGQVDGEVFLAQEYVEGQDVLALLDKLAGEDRKLPVEVSIYVASSIARGLEYAHDFQNLSLVHRDINPPNVRLTYDGEVKLLDFGIAASKLQGDEAQNKPAGKVAYMAPEQISGTSLDRRTDLYAIGVLLWEMLTGHPLGTRLEAGEPVLPEPGRLEAIKRIFRGELLPPSVFNPQVPATLDNIVLKLLARNPADRFASAGDVRAALMPLIPPGFNAEKALADEMLRVFDRDLERAARERLTAQARKLPPSAPTTAPVRSIKRPLTLAIPIVAALGVGTVVALSAARSEKHPGSAAIEASRPTRATTQPTAASPGISPPSATALTATRPELRSEPAPPKQPPLDNARQAIKSGPVRPPRPPVPDLEPAASPRPIEVDELAAARSAFNERDWPRALDHAGRATRNGGGAKAHALLGATYFKMGRYDEAERAYATAAELDPSDDRLVKRLELVRRTRTKAAGPPFGPTGAP